MRESGVQQGYFQGQTAGGSKRERTRSALLDATVSVVAAKGMEAAKILDEVKSEVALAQAAT